MQSTGYFATIYRFGVLICGPKNRVFDIKSGHGFCRYRNSIQVIYFQINGIAGHHTKRKRNPVLHSVAVGEIAVAIIILPKYVCRKENLVTHQYTAYRKIALATPGDSISTVELHPAETISAVHEHEPETHAPRLFVRMQIKGGKSTEFQIDTGATCNVLRKRELKGTKYERRIRCSPHVLKMYNNSTLIPLGKCKIQVRDPTTTKKFKVPFKIVEDHHVKSSLLGCRTVQQLDLIRVKPSTQVNQVSKDVPVPHPLGLKLEDVQETRMFLRALAP